MSFELVACGKCKAWRRLPKDPAIELISCVCGYFTAVTS